MSILCLNCLAFRDTGSPTKLAGCPSCGRTFNPTVLVGADNLNTVVLFRYDDTKSWTLTNEVRKWDVSKMYCNLQYAIMQSCVHVWPDVSRDSLFFLLGEKEKRISVSHGRCK